MPKLMKKVKSLILHHNLPNHGYSLVFLSMMVILCLISCRHSPKHRKVGGAKTVEVRETAVPELMANLPNPAYAMPIAPPTVTRFPHLAAHVGQMVLGDDRFQVILAGLAPEPGMSPWQPAILEMFERVAGGWKPLTPTGPIDLYLIRQFRKTQNPFYYMVGFDSQVSDGEASLIFRLATGRSEDPPLTLSYSLRRGQSYVRLRLEADKKLAVNEARELRWRLRLRPRRGSSLITNEPTRIHHPRALTRYYGPESVSLVSHSHATITEDQEDINFTPLSPKDGAWGGVVDLFIGREGAENFPHYFISLNRCRKSSQTELLDTRSQESCINQERGRRLTLAATTEPAALKRIPRSVYLLGADGLRYAYVPLLPEAESSVLISPRLPLRIAETTAQGIREIPLPKMKAGKAGLLITMTPRATAVLRLTMANSESLMPALLEIRSEDPDINWTPYLAENDQQLGVSPHGILVRSWPIQVTLPPGRYKVSLFRGDVGRFCGSEEILLAGTQNELTCAPPNAATHRSIPSVVWADLGQASGGRDIQDFQGLLGADVFTIDGPTFSQMPVAEINAHLILIPTLEVRDPNLGVALRAFGVTEGLIKEWNEYNIVGKTEPLLRFAQFMKSRGGGRFIELTCPDPAMSVEDYRRLVFKLDPHALQIFGCGSPSQQRRYLLMMAMIHQGRKQPVHITTAPVARGEFFRYSYLPQIALDHAGLGEGHRSVEGVLHSLRDGRFAVAAGLAMTVKPSAGQTSLIAPDGGSLRLRVGLRGRPGVRPHKILVFSETSLLFARTLPAMKKDGKLNVALAIPRKNPEFQWLRVEIRDAKEVVLATTNFLPLKEQKIPEKEKP